MPQKKFELSVEILKMIKTNNEIKNFKPNNNHSNTMLVNI